MSEQLKEALSAAMDDEADAFELRRVMDEASANPELREQWHQMHLMRDALREDQFFDGQELRQRIRAEMEELDVDQSDQVADATTTLKPVRTANWVGRLTGTAIAVAVFGWVVFNADTFFPADSFFPADTFVSADILAPVEKPAKLATTEPAVFTPLVPVMYSDPTQADRLRLDAHRMQHYQQNALNKAGAVAFVRLATFRKSAVTRPPARHWPAQLQPAQLQPARLQPARLQPARQ